MASAATVGILRVLLTADSAEFDSAMKRASDSAKSWSKDLGSIGQQATAIGSALTKALTVPIVGLGGAAIKMAMDFESSFAGVRKTVDATEPEFAQLAQGLRNMAKEIPVSVNELNKVAEAAGQLGIKKDDILAFTRTMADLGVTTNLTADEAATATAQIQNIFGAAGKETERFGATLVALGNAGASTEKDIIAMGLRIAGAGHQVGLTQGQVLAFASTLASVGINAEAGGSAISRVFLKINDAVATGGGAMAEFARVAGMTAAEFKTAFETDAAGATTAFIAGLARLKGEGENVNATIEGLVGKNIILKDTLLRASGAGTLLTDNLKLQATAWQDNTALTEEANKRYATFESQVKLLWAEVRDLGITLGTALIPTFKDLIAVARPLVAQIADVARLFGELPPGVRTTVVVIGALVAALGPAIFLFGQLALGAQAIVAAFTAKGIATRALTAIMATSTAQTGLFAMALTTLGTTAAVAATAFAAWNLGKWLGEITGATDWVGKLAAKVGELVGILPEGTAAQYDASRAAASAAQSATGLAQAQTTAATATTQVAAASAAAVPPVRALGAATEETGKKAKDATKDYREFMNWVGERQMEAAAIGIEAMDKVAASFQRGLTAMAPFKAAVKSTADEVRALGGSLSDLVSGSLLEYGTATTKAREEALRWAQANGAVLAPSIKQVTAASLTAATETVGIWAQTIATLPQVILGAIQGGGSVLSAAGAHIGTSIMAKFQTTFGPAIEAALPFGIGKAVTSLLPTLGALFGPVAKKLGDLFRNIFGGPSSAELAARGLVADFEEELAGTLTAAQRAEAGTDAWKQTVIALRDAYIAAGRSEEEALRDAERLWESSRDGAEATRRVIEEIRRIMNALPTEHTIDINVQTRISEGGGDGTLPSGDWHVTPVFNPGEMGASSAMSSMDRALGGQPMAPAGAASGGVTNNFIPVMVPSGAAGDSWSMARAIRKQLPAAIDMNEDGIREALERVIGDYQMTYSRG